MSWSFVRRSCLIAFPFALLAGSCNNPGADATDAGPGIHFAKDSGTENTNPTDAGTTVSGADASNLPPSGDAGTTGLTCTVRTCDEAMANCGPVGDGCGGVLQCGTCDAGTCGGGGTPSQCGSGSTCVPRSCLAVGANCGTVGDGCGGTVDCGTCGTGSLCGGGGQPNVCSGTHVTPCTGLCQQQASCPAGMTTTITGTVYAPTPSTYGSPDPLYNALVYIPNGPLEAFTPSVACETCGTPVSGAPLVSTTTDGDGKFTLQNAPSGANIPLVIQLGRWRRYVEIPTVTPCQANALTDPDMTRLPRKQAETSQWDNIPQIAMVTRWIDPLECVLLKLGIDASEFTTPTGTVAGSSPARPGRVQMYQNDGAKIAGIPSVCSLTSSESTLEQYDMVIFACDADGPSTEGGHAPPASCKSNANDNGSWAPDLASQQNVVSYANAGGRVFATHYGFAWLYNIQPFQGTATWTPDAIDAAITVTAIVNQTFNDGINFAKWLQNVGATTTLGNLTVSSPRKDFSAVNTSEAQQWLTVAPSQPLQYTFNTPVGVPAAQQCGRVLYSDFHVNNGTANGPGAAFPGECPAQPMTPQEKTLEFLIFDLSNCVQTGGVVAH